MKELEKLDVLRNRLNVTYSQAKEALDQCDGDLVEALVYLERKGFTQAEGQEDFFSENAREPKWDKAKTENFVRGIIEQVKNVIQEGNVTKVRLISGDKVLIDIPATFGVVGLGVVLFSPLLIAITAVGAATAVVREMVFEVEKSDGTIERRSLRFPYFGVKKDDAEQEEYEEAGEDGGRIWDERDE
jgi:hypothetical protein